ncbi:hypothetical protein PG997_014752 [Apiospora hydei]|uniref:Uncharacterized protein n=1 Tax=Apiospora hydei TaxID=1337664 RepID=A0ABR1UUQ6_9PEZI
MDSEVLQNIDLFPTANSKSFIDNSSNCLRQLSSISFWDNFDNGLPQQQTVNHPLSPPRHRAQDEKRFIKPASRQEGDIIQVFQNLQVRIQGPEREEVIKAQARLLSARLHRLLASFR